MGRPLRVGDVCVVVRARGSARRYLGAECTLTREIPEGFVTDLPAMFGAYYWGPPYCFRLKDDGCYDKISWEDCVWRPKRSGASDMIEAIAAWST